MYFYDAAAVVAAADAFALNCGQFQYEVYKIKVKLSRYSMSEFGFELVELIDFFLVHYEFLRYEQSERIFFLLRNKT